MSSRVFSIPPQSQKFESRADIESHLVKLRAIKDVEEIHLGGNSYGVDACLAVADELKRINTLKVADFADIFTGRLITEIPLALKALCDALVDKPTLVELNLCDNAFGGRSAEPMVNFLTNNRTFQVLKLNNNGMGIAGGTTVANALLESAKKSKAEGKPSNLRVIVCGRNRLENGSAPFWAEAFAAHGLLREVRMPQNGIRMEGIETIVKGLTSCKQLETLDLQDNTATEKGTRAVALALVSWPQLRTLNLSDCLLSPHGGVALASALARGGNKQLETLKLQFGEIDHRAINILAQAIAEHLPNLTALELNGNRADPEDECITNIREALESHGHGDALDELDEMEEYDEDAEEESPAVEEAEEQDADEAPTTAAVQVPDSTDALADLLGSVSIKPA